MHKFIKHLRQYAYRLKAIFYNCSRIPEIGFRYSKPYSSASQPGVNYPFGVICELEKGNLRKIHKFGQIF